MNYDDYNDFYGENVDYSDYNDDRDCEDNSGEIDWHDEIDDSMDGDTESALASAGWGTDEDYGYYGEDVDYREDFHADEAVGYVDYNEDGPYYD
jgi:hypothetical protein